MYCVGEEGRANFCEPCGSWGNANADCTTAWLAYCPDIGGSCRITYWLPGCH
jgi:hypothetical protein